MVIGFVYLLHPGPMPYHLKFINHRTEELTPEILNLMIFGKEAMGSLLISLGLAVFLLTKQLKNGIPWLRLSIVAIMAPPLATFLHITLAVGTYSPWWVVVVCSLCLAIGFLAAGTPKQVQFRNESESLTTMRQVKVKS